ncbi:ATP-binding protein [Candidatus Aerophobetes bacterium]|uniref:ATP-binding protein n=1 Tax=Aerophobetes bacterium TaxID=2030807 RepID=A0A523RTA3_UNCAE|nr:MAG: ATP-binding protein [Candidatus Aerophobetes bacterium]
MVKIAEITDQNRWWSQGEDFARYDHSLGRAKPIFFERRQIELKKGGIYILRGPRQVGKTTYFKDLVRKLIASGVPPRDILYLSLDSFTSRRELRNAINYFLDTRRDANWIYLLLDEITSLEEWNLELKFIADQGILERCTILATGSSAVKLKEKGELLPGRGLEGNEYYLKPLSFREFVIQSVGFISPNLSDTELSANLGKLGSVLSDCFLELSSDLNVLGKKVEAILPFKRELGYLFRLYLISGGLPGVINHYFSNRYLHNKDTIDPVIAEVFIRDVLGDLARLQKQETIIRQILRAIVGRYGSRYTFSGISRDVERTHITTIDYLELMEESFISFVLYAYDFNKNDIKSKGDKKTYFFDPFIFHSVKGYLEGKEVWDLITRSLEDEDLLGNFVEAMVISHLRMYGEIPFLKTANTFLWYYYDKSGREIDAIFKENAGYSGLEVKYRGQVDERMLKRIAPVKKYIILSKEDVGGRGDMMIIPVDIFLALLPVSERNV